MKEVECRRGGGGGRGNNTAQYYCTVSTVLGASHLLFYSRVSLESGSVIFNTVMTGARFVRRTAKLVAGAWIKRGRRVWLKRGLVRNQHERRLSCMEKSKMNKRPKFNLASHSGGGKEGTPG